MGTPVEPAPYDLKRTMGRIGWVALVAMIAFGAIAMATGQGFSFSLFGDNGPKVEIPQGGLAEGGRGRVGRAGPDRAGGDVEPGHRSAGGDTPGRRGLDRRPEWPLVRPQRSHYEIVQVGSAATITEVDAFGNITATGDGVIEGDTFFFDYLTAAFTTGSGQLTVSPDGFVAQRHVLRRLRQPACLHEPLRPRP